MTPSDDILIRIRKLLALSQNNPNQHEAELAASRVQEILQTYNLSMAEVAASTHKQNPQASTTHAKRVKNHVEKSAMYKYQQTLMKALSANNFCNYWLDEGFNPDPRGNRFQWDGTKEVRGRMVKRHMLLGSEVNVTVTSITYEYLVDTMDRLLPYSGMQKRGKDALIWLDGCAERLAERLNELRRERERAEEEKRRNQPQTAGLVRLSDVYATEAELNTDFTYGREPGTTTRMRLEREAKWRAEADREQELVKQGVSPRDAYYLARGMTPPVEVVLTAAEKARAEARERKANRARNARWAREDEADARRQAKEDERRAHPVFQHGRRTANDIGLDAQVKAGDRKKVNQ